ncbi:hypothetical protein EDB86DRAFT_3071119 [Lactarius hatsudake]|nr:hypothetical protein EDB86DRAFT_3071119 [Lactarius hatsudake]
MQIPSLAVLSSLVLLAASDFAAAQINAPECSSYLNWTSNFLGQTACTVTAYMLATCNGSVFTIKPGAAYFGGNSAFKCGCNVIAYNLFSACDACQGLMGYRWSQYSVNCTNTPSFLTFPNPVPSGTSVPQWALVDSILEDNWNVTEAYLIYQNAVPDLETGSSVSAFDSGSVSPTSSTSKVSPTSSTSEVSPTPSTSSSGGSPPPSSPGNGSNTGPIAGGVVGGVVALAVIGGLLFYFLRRRQRSQALSAAVDGGTPPMSQEHPPLSGNETYVPQTPVAPMSFYDPNDPRTFPKYQRVPTSVQDVYVPAAFTPGYHGLPTV